MVAVIGVALKSQNPGIRLWGVETSGADSMSQALRAGEPLTLSKITSRAKTLGAQRFSPLTLRLSQELLEEVVVVRDDDAAEAPLFLLQRTKVLTELAASCTLAAPGARKDRLASDDHVVLVLYGGNASLTDLLPMSYPTYPGIGRADSALPFHFLSRAANSAVPAASADKSL